MDIREKIEDLAMNFEACHKTLAAMGDETRQHIILEMMRMDYNGSRVPYITARTNLSRPAVSHHLQILKDAGIVKMRKEITGTVLNGKGEEKEIHEQGVSVAEVLYAAGVDPAQVNNLKVTAADEFYAQLAGDEIREEGKAFLAEDGQGGMKLIVFGDSNAKRNVRDVVRLDTD